MQPLLKKCDFVLRKKAIVLSGGLRGKEGQQGVIVVLMVVDQPIPGAPNEIVPISEWKTVLELEIIGLQVFAKCARNVSVGSIIVPLKAKIGFLGKDTRPPSEDIASTHAQVAVVRLAHPPLVGVALQGNGILGGCRPIQAE